MPAGDPMRGAIVYMGKYGSTAQYALWLAEATGFELIDLGRVPRPDLQPYSHLLLGSSVHCGWLRIGGWLRRQAPQLRQRELALFSVSGLPPQSPLLKVMVLTSLGPRLAKTPWFPLPGRLIHGELSTLDRLLLQGESRLGLGLGAHPGQYMSSGGDFNFVSRRELAPLIAWLREHWGLTSPEDSALRS